MSVPDSGKSLIIDTSRKQKKQASRPLKHRHRTSHYSSSELCEETAGGGADDNIIITMVSENPKNTPTYDIYGEEFKLLGGYCTEP